MQYKVHGRKSVFWGWFYLWNVYDLIKALFFSLFRPESVLGSRPRSAIYRLAVSGVKWGS